MTQPLSFAHLQDLQEMNAEQRYTYLLAQANEQQQLWILVGDGGSVLLNSDGNDCVPVWPHEELAEQHIQGDWSDCTCMAISLEDWHVRWTNGLTADQLHIAGFISDDEEGVIVSASDFDDDLLAALGD